jgi:hypothetical protein
MSVKIGDTVSLRLTPRITGLRASSPAPGWQEPLNESHRMMMRSLAYLDGRVRGGKAGTVTVDRAGQVNIASAVETATYRRQPYSTGTMR